MENFGLVASLSVITLLMVIGLARWSKWRTEQRREDPEAPKSTLAADTPNK